LQIRRAWREPGASPISTPSAPFSFQLEPWGSLGSIECKSAQVGYTPRWGALCLHYCTSSLTLLRPGPR
jgi:hypothetical protein